MFTRFTEFVEVLFHCHVTAPEALCQLTCYHHQVPLDEQGHYGQIDPQWVSCVSLVGQIKAALLELMEPVFDCMFGDGILAYRLAYVVMSFGHCVVQIEFLQNQCANFVAHQPHFFV